MNEYIIQNPNWPLERSRRPILYRRAHARFILLFVLGHNKRLVINRNPIKRLKNTSRRILRLLYVKKRDVEKIRPHNGPRERRDLGTYIAIKAFSID